MNFAINLSEGSSGDRLSSAVAEAESLGAATLAQYNELGTFFAQSSSPTFAADLGKLLTDKGVVFDSIGPTRQAAVTGDELVVATSEQVTPHARSFQLERTDNQLIRESRIQEPEAVTSESSASGGGGAQSTDADSVTPDPLTSAAWGVIAIGALKAQDVDVPLEPVTVGILDSGVDGTHEDLKDQIDVEDSVGCSVNGIADTSWDAWQPDTSSHGTHVAGTVAAAHNGIGVDGVAPSVMLAAVKTGNADGFFYPEYAACAFVWAGEHHFDVTNNSYYVDPWEYWVPDEPSQAAGYESVRRAVAYSTDEGVVTVAAAGNSDNDIDNLTTDDASPNDTTEPTTGRDVSEGLDIPAMLPGVVTVSSVAVPGGGDPRQADAETVTLERSSFSNYGAEGIDVAAPGSYIGSTVPESEGGYVFMSGTSMASPHVTGVAALIKAIHPDFTPEETVALLKKQAGYTYDRLAAPTDGKEYRGAGLVNALAAVTDDQPQPVIGDAEYSTDGGATWAPLVGAQVAGPVTVRVNVTGPVTVATLSVGDLATTSGTADGSFDGAGITLTADVDLSGVTSAEDVDLVVSAQGRNNDPEADDDVSTEMSFIAVPAPEPTPEPSDSEEPSNSASPEPSVSSSAQASEPGKLAQTGTDAGASLLLALGGLLAGATLMLASRRKSLRS